MNLLLCLKSIQKNKNGFTLVELSIVLVIIGLIVGGILTGQELIHAAGVRATISQITTYNTAVNTFQNKYNALPGDFVNTAKYIPDTNLITPNALCGSGWFNVKGDGDGLIGYIQGGPSSSFGISSGVGVSVYSDPPTNQRKVYNEHGLFWGSLAILGLIEGNYTSCASGSIQMNPSFPAMKSNSNYGIFAYGNANDANNYYQLGVNVMSTVPGLCNTNNSFSPGNAFAIDSKMDDGNPVTGIVVARGGVAAQGLEMQPSTSASTSLSTAGSKNCLYGGAYTAGTDLYYNTSASSTSKLCALRIKMQY